jgi:hypothetical protein
MMHTGGGAQHRTPQPRITRRADCETRFLARGSPLPYFPASLVKCRLTVQVQALLAQYLKGRKSESLDAQNT